MKYKLFIKLSAKKELFALEKSVAQRVNAIILKLGDNPRPARVVKLQGWDLYRVRTGDYRILYTVNDKKQVVEIVAIGHRREIYRF